MVKQIKVGLLIGVILSILATQFHVHSLNPGSLITSPSGLSFSSPLELPAIIIGVVVVVIIAKVINTIKNRS